MTKPSFQYEPVEAFGESLTTAKPWNKQALVVVERLNGRVAMVGFTAAGWGSGSVAKESLASCWAFCSGI